MIEGIKIDRFCHRDELVQLRIVNPKYLDLVSLYVKSMLENDDFYYYGRHHDRIIRVPSGIHRYHLTIDTDEKNYKFLVFIWKTDHLYEEILNHAVTLYSQYGTTTRWMYSLDDIFLTKKYKTQSRPLHLNKYDGKINITIEHHGQIAQQCLDTYNMRTELNNYDYIVDAISIPSLKVIDQEKVNPLIKTKLSYEMNNAWQMAYSLFMFNKYNKYEPIDNWQRMKVRKKQIKRTPMIQEAINSFNQELIQVNPAKYILKQLGIKNE